MSVATAAAPAPIEITVPTNVTLVIGSETHDQRHAFIAVSVFDSAAASRIPETFSTREPGVRGPMKISGPAVQPTSASRRHHLKGVVAEVAIDERGNVLSAHAIPGRYSSPGDERTIEDTIRLWKFAPATRKGQPVRVVTSVVADYP